MPRYAAKVGRAIASIDYCEIRTTLDTTFGTRFNTTFDTTFKNRARSFQSFKSIQTDIVII